uniref:WGS project CBMF000000000 data, contig CS5834_c001196 n=1 Tax=Fusarium pseudograminearum CS5834 TaxID=1318459 RepID=A0A096PFL8_FUSPS|nr:unnamed protein product [Fusarium pseudograminearum CS5834]
MIIDELPPEILSCVCDSLLPMGSTVHIYEDLEQKRLKYRECTSGDAGHNELDHPTTAYNLLRFF